MCINNTSHLISINRSNNRTLFVGNTKFTLGRPKIANFNSAKTFKITNLQTLIFTNISSFTVYRGNQTRVNNRHVPCVCDINPGLTNKVVISVIQDTTTILITLAFVIDKV